MDISLKLAHTKIVMSFEVNGFAKSNFVTRTVILAAGEEKVEWHYMEYGTGKWLPIPKTHAAKLERHYVKNFD